MKPNELRFGNIVYAKNEIETIIGIERQRVVVFANGMINGEGVEYKDIKGIPLTADLLRRFGFTAIEDSNYYDDQYGNQLYFKGDSAIWVFNSHPIRHDIKYLHELQNIYYALIGAEIAQIDIQNGPYLHYFRGGI